MAFFSSKKNKDNIAQKSVSENVKTTKAPKTDKKSVEGKAGKLVEAKTAVATPAKVAMPKAVGAAVDFSHDLASMILRPRVTEKATMSAEGGVYVFEVSKDSNKNKIAKAIAVMYKVSPIKVRVVNLPAKSVFIRGKWGTKTAVKKAYVYLKKGEKIEII